jgi:hypothetical protein
MRHSPGLDGPASFSSLHEVRDDQGHDDLTAAERSKDVADGGNAEDAREHSESD